MNRSLAALLIGSALVLVAALTPAAAQGRFVQLDGQVQWIAGQKLMLLLTSGGGVDVDIARVPLDQYRTLTQGDPVVVIGTVSQDNRKVYATSVRRGSLWNDQSP